MNATSLNLQGLLRWSEPKQVKTKRGPRRLQTALPDNNFWALWRSRKNELQNAGISVSKNGDGSWDVCWWQELERTPRATVERMNGGPVKATIKDNARSEQEENCNRLPEESFTTASRSGAIPEVAFAPSGSSAGSVAFTPAALPAGIVLSSEQAAIHDWFENGTGNLVVDAKAGTGKTFTITFGFGRVKVNGTFVYCVFGKKNQREALEKITDPRVTVLTLNAAGFRYCRSVRPGCKPDDSVEDDRIRAVCPNIPDEAVTSVNKLIGFAKNLFVGVPSQVELEQIAIDRGVFCGVKNTEGDDEFPIERLAEVAKLAIEMALDVPDSAGRISFNDQVWLAVSKNWVRPSYDLVVVDETQDMNVPQLAMVQRMAVKNGRICVVGDPRQCIYTFRGAHPDGMGMMTTALNAKVLGLSVTRRCPKVVVRHVNSIVSGYTAAPDAIEGVLDGCNEGGLFERLQVGDAVLSRTNAPLMPLCLALLRKGVSARIEGRDIGQQLLGMVRKFKAKSVPDFLRKLDSWAEKQKSRLNIGKLGSAKCAVIDDQQQTLQALAEGCANVSEIETRIDSLFKDSDKETKPAVVLSSTHKAKGLEWERVALLSWTYRRTRKGMTDDQKTEEENLYYVACTRAKRQLTLVTEGGKNKLKEQPDGSKVGVA